MFTTRTPTVRGVFWKNLALVLLLDWAVSLEALAVPSGPDVIISAYDVPVDPVGLSFGADGALFVGRDNAGSGGGNADAVRIHRIAPGGEVMRSTDSSRRRIRTPYSSMALARSAESRVRSSSEEDLRVQRQEKSARFDRMEVW